MATTFTEPKTRPLILPASRIPAALDGSLTQIRVPLKPQPPLDWKPSAVNGMYDWVLIPNGTLHCPYGKPGDRLYLKETFAPINTEQPLDRYTLPSYRARVKFDYAADHEPGYKAHQLLTGYELKWRPPQSMPQWASRLTLEICEVRVQRVQEISTADVYAEGVGGTYGETGIKLDWKGEGYEWDNMTAQEAFAWFWDTLHGAGAWSRNDWTWALTVRKI